MVRLEEYSGMANLAPHKAQRAQMSVELMNIFWGRLLQLRRAHKSSALGPGLMEKAEGILGLDNVSAWDAGCDGTHLDLFRMNCDMQC